MSSETPNSIPPPLAAALAAALARRFPTMNRAETLLLAARLPMSRLPAWGDRSAIEYWTIVLHELELGLVEDGIRWLADAACERYPACREFAEVRSILGSCLVRE